MIIEYISPNIEILDKYFEYESNFYKLELPRHRRVNNYPDRKTKLLNWLFLEAAHVITDENTITFKRQLKDYDLSSHYDNFFFEGALFIWMNKLDPFGRDYKELKEERLRLMELIVKYGKIKEFINFLDNDLTLEITIIKKSVPEKVAISDSFLIQDILESIKVNLSQRDSIAANLFQTDLFKQDKEKQLNYLTSNKIKKQTGRRNKNFFLEQFINNIRRYLDNETTLNTPIGKNISEKQCSFIYNYLTFLGQINPDKIGTISPEAYIRTIISNSKRKKIKQIK